MSRHSGCPASQNCSDLNESQLYHSLLIHAERWECCLPMDHGAKECFHHNQVSQEREFVFVTDRELALMNGMQPCYLNAATFLYIWHMSKNILTNNHKDFNVPFGPWASHVLTKGVLGRRQIKPATFTH
ncbi:hypothetical protein PsorP6_006620 [Peronosclerospora sorghi]|uniref:Uncharacterized protein n=1 Tax=Peronosclerospora sorghi TaxID=230839 RepID=A0ACC0W4V7_9STRA|nr:hypothetical protein PsorP6_006620 [Peronosclerospora sorghi]